MQITFLTRKFRNKERNLHCDVVHITTKWVSSLTLDCNGVFAIKAYGCVMRSRAGRYLGNVKAIVDDIVDDIVTRGMAFTLDVCCWRSLDVSSIDIYII